MRDDISRMHQSLRDDISSIYWLQVRSRKNKSVKPSASNFAMAASISAEYPHLYAAFDALQRHSNSNRVGGIVASIPAFISYNLAACSSVDSIVYYNTHDLFMPLCQYVDSPVQFGVSFVRVYLQLLKFHRLFQYLRRQRTLFLLQGCQGILRGLRLDTDLDLSLLLL